MAPRLHWADRRLRAAFSPVCTADFIRSGSCRRAGRRNGGCSVLDGCISILLFFVVDRWIRVSIMRTSSSAAVLERRRSGAGRLERLGVSGSGRSGVFRGGAKKIRRMLDRVDVGST